MPRGDRTGFRCHLCGHRIQAGEAYMMLYANDMQPAPGNALICCEHQTDTIDALRERWFAHATDGLQRFWWMRRDDD